LAKHLDADMTWVAKMEKPNTILIEAAWLDVDEQADVATTLCC
jgi:hypothetical protein